MFHFFLLCISHPVLSASHPHYPLFSVFIIGFLSIFLIVILSVCINTVTSVPIISVPPLLSVNTQFFRRFIIYSAIYYTFYFPKSPLYLSYLLIRFFGIVINIIQYKLISSLLLSFEIKNVFKIDVIGRGPTKRSISSKPTFRRFYITFFFSEQETKQKKIKKFIHYQYIMCIFFVWFIYFPEEEEKLNIRWVWTNRLFHLSPSH